MLSALARVEVPSALWRMSMDGRISAADAGLVVREFEVDWREELGGPRRFQPIAITTELLAVAAALTGTHNLRSLDAIQLASALAAREADEGCDTIVVLDERLRRAAATERFELLPA
jgi:predicted nucleic acid-binding protein